MAIIEVDEMDFEETLSKEFDKGNIVILQFTSEYCDACMALGFELEEIDDKYNNVSILEIDCADSTELANRYEVAQVPSMLIYKNKNTILYHKEGVVLYQDIEEIINT